MGMAMKSSLVLVVGTALLWGSTSLVACGGEGSAAGTGGDGLGGAPSGGMNPGGSAGEGDAEGSEISLIFRAQLGQEPFACGAEYPDQGLSGTTVTPRDFRFYVSDLRLVTVYGEEVPVAIAERSPFQASGVALLDFEDGTEGCADGNAALNGRITGSVATDEYVGVVFSLSVPPELNHGNPATAPAPLQAGGMTWGWLMGYRFLVGELAQVDGTGIGLFHLGSTGCDNSLAAEGGAGGEGGASPDYGSPPLVACDHPNRAEIRLEDFDVEADVIVADLGAVFSEIDLTAMAMCHGMGEACPPLFSAVGLGTNKEQTIFRVERK